MVKEEMNLSLFADEPVNFQRGECKEIVFYIKERIPKKCNLGDEGWESSHGHLRHLPLVFLVHIWIPATPAKLKLIPSCSSASMTSDFRKRRRSEPAVGQPRGLGDPSARSTSPGRADLPGSSTTLTKSFISSSPSSPSRAKGELQ